ncbi:metallophosphoesterase [Paenalcaligenes niemegkensis]|uniref:metallophosphoesterase n=1 Tax=Paenalcaligenes niemegkensis TaxID=2895469 RepID=UPI001EE7DFDD|nr:metallophosphoesterase [Paenalcaligenes niemegkensis]MCQ9616679.1 metallophosphoesterase [Paenalcaligenes niemegkensis]
MRIQLLSDLHLEVDPGYVPQAAPDVDVLVLAGDIGSHSPHSALEGADFGLSRFSPLLTNAKWPRVLYIPGNHEFDWLDYDATYVRLRKLCDQLGIEWLDREIITIGSVRFIGTTLWSDFEALALLKGGMTEQMRELEKAYRAADFYLRKNTTARNGKPLLAEQIRELAKECQSWLYDALLTPFEGTTVTVTHFAPTLESADPRYGLTPGTAGFCNSMEEFLPFTQLWMHGHLHCRNDFIATGSVNGEAYRCRIVANPRGYEDKDEQKDFQEKFCIELP